VQLFANITSANLYLQQVQRSAAQQQNNDTNAIENFVTSTNYFVHTDCYSIVQHKTNSNLYLYAVYNNAQSLYFINNVQATKQEVAQYLTNSAAQQLINATNIVHNVTNNITHSVQVRTIALANIVSINANKQTVSV
jgi:hypothetical protein